MSVTTTSKTGTGLLFSSDSLKEFLGVSKYGNKHGNKQGNSNGKRKKTTSLAFAEQSNAYVQEILRAESQKSLMIDDTRYG
jgi:hypothetical protein